MKTPTLQEWLSAYPKGTEIVTINEKPESKIAIAILSIPDGHALSRIEYVTFPMDLVTMTAKEFGTYVGQPVRKIYHADREKGRSQVFVSEDYGKHRIMMPFSNPLLDCEFDWGYVGIFPRNLARAILTDALTKESYLVERHCNDFASRFIANLPCGKWEIYEDDVKQWIKNVEGGRLL